MTQPPPEPSPGSRPWHSPGGDPSQGQSLGPQGEQTAQSPPDPHGTPQTPPAYGVPYGQAVPQPPSHGPATGYGGFSQYGGPPGPGHPDPAAGLASRWARLGAAIIDIIILGTVGTLISLPFVHWARFTDTSGGTAVPFSAEQYKVNLIALILGFLYFWLLTANWSGQTVGKKVLGIRVVRADDRGAISQSQAALRSLVYSVFGNICGCFGFVDVAWILWDRRKQAIHDKVAKTVVVKVNPGDPNPYRTSSF